MEEEKLCDICCSDPPSLLCKNPVCQRSYCTFCMVKYMESSMVLPNCPDCKYEFTMIQIGDNKIMEACIKNVLEDHHRTEYEKLVYNIDIEKYKNSISKYYKRTYKPTLKLNSLPIHINLLSLNIVEKNTDGYIKMALYDYENYNTIYFHIDNDTESEVKVVLCPKCPGIIKDGICIECEKSFCIKCKELLHDNECNPEQLQFIKSIQNTSKQCPNCRVWIERVSGCDQMWCTQCHIAFSWNTGKRVFEPIHNPHYFEHNRARPQVMIGCIDINTIKMNARFKRNIMSIVNILQEPERQSIYNIKVIHILYICSKNKEFLRNMYLKHFKIVQFFKLLFELNRDIYQNLLYLLLNETPREVIKLMRYYNDTLEKLKKFYAPRLYIEHHAITDIISPEMLQKLSNESESKTIDTRFERQ